MADFPLPAEQIDAGLVVLRRTCYEDAAELARAVGESLEHLKPWMSWATPDAGELDSQRQRIARARALWDQGDCMYVARSAGDGVVVGGCGLHRRVGPGGIEIGYWVHVRYTGRGYATTAAEALTKAALALPDIERVEIHCDQANVRSQSIPRRLGYRLDRIEDCETLAPAEEGKRMVWVLDRPRAGHR
jgi:RimJ/RimL family protein N-acetyltransferase